MRTSTALFPPHAFRFMGGGGGSPAPVQQIAQAPTATPTPPVTATSQEVIQAQQDVLQQEMLKKSIKKTIYAGDTGGFKPPTGMAPGIAGPGTAGASVKSA